MSNPILNLLEVRLQRKVFVLTYVFCFFMKFLHFFIMYLYYIAYFSIHQIKLNVRT